MPIELKHDLVLLREGLADHNCLKNLIEKRHGIPSFNMLPEKEYRGVSGFEETLKAIRGDKRNFMRLKGVLIVADSGNSPGHTFGQIRKQIISARGYPVPSQPMEVAARTADHPAVAVMLLPDESTPGGLETLRTRNTAARAMGRRMFGDIPEMRQI